MGQSIEQPIFDISNLSMQDIKRGFHITDKSGSESWGRRFIVRVGAISPDKIIFSDIVNQLKHIAKEEKDSLKNLKAIKIQLGRIIELEAESQIRCEARMQEEFFYKVMTLISRIFQSETSGEALISLKTKVDNNITDLEDTARLEARRNEDLSSRVNDLADRINNLNQPQANNSVLDDIIDLF